MEPKKYNFETPERVAYGGPWVSFVTAIFLFRAATGLGLFEAKTFVEANMNMNDQREVNTRELGEMIKAWWDEKGIPKRHKEAEQKALQASRLKEESSWEAIGPEDCRSEETLKKVINDIRPKGPVISKLGELLKEHLDKEVNEKTISARQDGWRGIDREDPWSNVMSNPDKPR